MKIYGDVDLYFVTTAVVDWVPVFTANNYFEVMIESLRYCREKKGLKVHAYVIMLNHLHLIVSSDDQTPGNLSNVIRDLKRFTSRQITQLLREEGNRRILSIFKEYALRDGRKNKFKVWQEGFHPKGIFDEKFGLQKLKYVHNNPVKKGYVLKPEHWRYSSAGFYCGYDNVPLPMDDIFSFKK